MRFIHWLQNKFIAKESPHILVLLVVFLFFVFVNFPFQTWFTGWDNLHPEFNFWLNIKRAIFAGWQENQGLGLLGGHGFAATLPHTIFLWLLALVIPLQYLRATFTFLMLFTGSLGSFYLTRQILKGREGQISSIASLFAGLFYMLNLATIQQFFIPMEAFTVHFAALPWLFLTLLLLLEKWTRRRLILFAVVNFLATPQGFIPPLFLVYLISLGVILLIYLGQAKTLESVKSGILVFLITLTINAYWLLPLSHYTFNKSQIYLNSYNNLVSTEDFILKNRKFGTFTDVVMLKGFISEAIDTIESGKIFYIFQPWHDHWQNPAVSFIGYFFFGVILLGFIVSLKEFRSYHRISFALLFIFAFTALAVDLPPFSYFSNLFQQISLFKQAFRAGFTKFSVSLALFYSLFLAMGIYFLINLIANRFLLTGTYKKLRSFFFIFFISLVSGLLVLFSLPSFKGHFFYKRAKISIPQSYFQLFAFFAKENPNTRIANLPQGWNWGWSLYRWGYSGSGFLWYGIEQPIMDRAFDVWSNFNENYYWELRYILYSRDFSKLENLFDKYQIDWIVFDDNFISYPNPRSQLYADDLKTYLDQSNKFTLMKTFSSNGNSRPIKVYKVNREPAHKDFVFLAKNLPFVAPSYNWNDYDLAYLENGDYIYDRAIKLSKKIIYYPFRSLFTGRKQEELEFSVEDKGDYYSFFATLPKKLAGAKLIIPALSQEETVEIDPTDLSKTTNKYPQIFLDGELIPFKGSAFPTEVILSSLREGNFEVRIPKIRGHYSYDSDVTNDVLTSTLKTCAQFNEGLYTHNKVSQNEKTLLRLTSIDASNCLDIDLPNLPQRGGYLAVIEARNIEGKGLLFAVINKNSRRPELETSLSMSKAKNQNSKVKTFYFIIPPREEYGLGYSLHFDNISIGKEKAVNDLGKITINPIPYEFLTGLVLRDPNAKIGPSKLIEVDVRHPNPSLYSVTIQPSNNVAMEQSVLILSQSYERGWKAYEIENGKWKVENWIASLFPFLFGEEVKEHVLVNNWANGWVLGNYTLDAKPYTLVIIYLPQYLEFAGFGLIIIVLTSFVILTKRGIRVYSQAHVNLQNKTAN